MPVDDRDKVTEKLDFEPLGNFMTGLPTVDVSEHGVDRRHHFQLRQDRGITHIAGVNDRIDLLDPASIYVSAPIDEIDAERVEVGPQVAEKLGLPQITYAETIDSLRNGEIVVTRALPLGTETVRCKLPCLLTVMGSANQPRPPSVHRLLAYKMAATPFEYASLLEKWPEFETEEALEAYLDARGRKITVWSGEDAGVDYDRVGLSGSPTKVLKIDSVVLGAEGSKEFEASDAGVSALVQEVVEDYIL